MWKCIIFILLSSEMVHCTIKFREIINITELKAMGPINLNPSCSITQFADSNRNENYNFMSTFGTNDVISNIYNEYFVEYNDSSLIIDGYNNPMPADVTSLKNDLNNILLCYSGCETNQTEDNKYIYCKMFYNSSLITNNFIINIPNELNLMTADYPQIILNKANNLFIVFYSKYFTMEDNYISYSIIDNNHKLIKTDRKLNYLNTPTDEPQILNVISSSFNNDLFLITMTYLNFYKLIGWIGQYDNVSGSVKILNHDYFEIVNRNDVFNDGNYGQSISINITNDCCFITPYFTNYNISTNKLYLTIFDISGKKIFNNDTYTSELNYGDECGAVYLKMVNSEATTKYILIYAIADHYVNGYVFTLDYDTNHGQYSLNYINFVNLQNNNQTQKYRNACFSILNDKLCMVSLIGPYTSNPKIFGQSWEVLN